MLSDGTSVYDKTFELEQTQKKTISLGHPAEGQAPRDRHQRRLRTSTGSVRSGTPRRTAPNDGREDVGIRVAPSSRPRGRGLVAATSPAASAAPRPAWHVTIKASATTMTLGQKVVLTGKVNKSAAGRLVVLQERARPVRGGRTRRTRGPPGRSLPGLGQADGEQPPPVPDGDAGDQGHKKGVSQAVVVDVFQWTSLTTLPAVNQVHFDSEPSVSMNGETYPYSLEADI